MLFALAAKFNNSIMGGGSPAVTVQLIEDLVNYVVHHFKCEEEWYREVFLPTLNEHNAMHEDIKRQLVSRILAIKKGQVPMTADIAIFFDNWIRHHILEEDLKAIIWCKQQAAKLAAANDIATKD
jgi:hemerythrin